MSVCKQGLVSIPYEELVRILKLRADVKVNAALTDHVTRCFVMVVETEHMPKYYRHEKETLMAFPLATFQEEPAA